MWPRRQTGSAKRRLSARCFLYLPVHTVATTSNRQCKATPQRPLFFPDGQGFSSAGHTHSHTPSIAFRHLPPMKDVVNQCLELKEGCRKTSVWSLTHSQHRFPAPSSKDVANERWKLVVSTGKTWPRRLGLYRACCPRSTVPKTRYQRAPWRGTCEAITPRHVT